MPFAALALAAVLVLPLLAAAPARAAVPRSPRGFDRKLVLRRAQRWVDLRVPYSQSRWFAGYRQDCSGFVSMAWVLRASYPTGMMDLIAKPIPKWALEPGDILLNNSSTYPHVVLFGGWMNKAHTRYLGFEQIGSAGRPVRRVLPYPYRVHPRLYTPYRFTGIPLGMAGNPRPRPKAVTVARRAPATAAPLPKPVRVAERSDVLDGLPLAAISLLAPAVLVGLVWRYRDFLGW
jgi:hypothetical protein